MFHNVASRKGDTIAVSCALQFTGAGRQLTDKLGLRSPNIIRIISSWILGSPKERWHQDAIRATVAPKLHFLLSVSEAI